MRENGTFTLHYMRCALCSSVPVYRTCKVDLVLAPSTETLPQMVAAVLLNTHSLRSHWQTGAEAAIGYVTARYWTSAQ
jgi:hypothetical protein